jgi:hypothetical protein
MKTILLLLSLSACAALAGSPKVTTIVSKPFPDTNATLSIPAGQAAKVLQFEGGTLFIDKGEVAFPVTGEAAIVEGPATLRLVVSGNPLGALATVERWRIPQNVPAPVAGFQNSGKVQTLITYANSTNTTLEIPAGQAVKVISQISAPTGNGGVALTKDGAAMTAASNAAVVRDAVVEGPATVTVWANGGGSTLATIERWKVPRVVPVLNNR